MIRGAAELLAERGLQGTSFADLIERTGAPRGSIYHHFPGGKDELVREAVRRVGTGVVALLDALDAASPGEVLDAFVGGWQLVLEGSDYRSGCAVGAVSIGAGADAPELLPVAGEVFRSWRAALTDALRRAGARPADADELAVTAIAVVEGGLVLGRATRDPEVFEVLRRRLRRLV